MSILENPYHSMTSVNTMGLVEYPIASSLGKFMIGMLLLKTRQQHVIREVSMLLPEDWKVTKAVGAIVLDRIHMGMKIFPTSMVATAILQQSTGLDFGE